MYILTYKGTGYSVTTQKTLVTLAVEGNGKLGDWGQR